MSTIIENPAPLQNNYLPENYVDREDEQARLQTVFSSITENSSRNLHLYGPRGQGKTHLLHTLLEELPSNRVNTCYIPCHRFDTQYKALKQLYQAVTRDEIKDGYHTSGLQREIEDRTQAVQTVVVLDEIDFALLNDGDSLLYYLSRIDNTENLSIITISANHDQLPIEERTQSSLQPERIHFPVYSAEQTYQILRKRAQKVFKQQTLQREALTYIASTTSNIQLGLTWLHTAAEAADNTVTEDLVDRLQSQTHQKYADELLNPFSTHHSLLYQAIRELTEENDRDTIQTGIVYTRYQELCTAYHEETLSNRRISDYLKHLELLQLIQAEYHYGGQKGKTREIQTRRSFERP